MDTKERAYLGYQNHSEKEARLSAVEKQLGLIDSREAELARLMESRAQVVATSEEGVVIREADVTVGEDEKIVTLISESDPRSDAFRYAAVMDSEVVLSSDGVEGSVASYQEALASGLSDAEAAALLAVNSVADDVQTVVQALSLVDIPPKSPRQRFDLAA